VAFYVSPTIPIIKCCFLISYSDSLLGLIPNEIPENEYRTKTETNTKRIPKRIPKRIIPKRNTRNYYRKSCRDPSEKIIKLSNFQKITDTPNYTNSSLTSIQWRFVLWPITPNEKSEELPVKWIFLCMTSHSIFNNLSNSPGTSEI